MKEQAQRVLTGTGWLARQPRAFQREVLRRGMPASFQRGDPIYRFGDPPGGIHGLVAGSFTVHTAPPGASPLMPHLSAPGEWIGEASYLTGEPRRVELRAVTDCAVLILPIDQMQQMAVAGRLGGQALCRDLGAARRSGDPGDP